MSEAISKVLDELFSIGLKNVLIVDGYSSEGTLDIVKKYAVSIIFQHGRDKAGAIKTAFEKVKTPYMVIMAAQKRLPSRNRRMTE